jgi:glycosyltransferase involved in cell wall biosynthesis
MAKIRILLVGDGNSIFVTSYAKWLKKENIDFQVDIFSTSVIRDENTSFFDRVIRIEQYPHFYFINKYKGIRRILLISIYRKVLKDLPAYDFVHFQFISPLRFSLINLIKRTTKSKIVLSIWGSDLYKLNPIDKISFKNICLKADKISMANPQTIEYFKSVFNWKKDNIRECRFGLSPLENITELSLDKAACKEELGWNKDKLAVVIGYNAALGQQHLRILEQLSHDQIIALKEKILLVLPLSYGGSASYKKDISSAMRELPFEYISYQQYLSDFEIACLRKASDIMIQLQVKDQFSGSMQEHIFAGNVVVTGKWLPYKSMKDLGIYFEDIEDVADLKDMLPEIIRNFRLYQEKTSCNEAKIADLSLWGNNISNWSKLYK